ncbi:hypothetical protein JW935_17160 [candidate division KSB1 bacterium]|nr:hypothetical protein [candidate division KSB1 bacterium]
MYSSELAAIFTTNENLKKSLQQEQVILLNDVDDLTSMSHLLSKNKGVLYSIGSGIFNPMGEDDELTNLGLNINGEWFHRTAENIYLGSRIAYNYCSVNENVLMNKLSDDSINKITGSLSVFELLFGVKFMSTQNENQYLRRFVQTGGGFYIMHSQAEISQSYKHGSEITSSSETVSKVGLNLGVGIIIGDRSNNTKLSIYPVYSVVFTEEPTKFFTVYLGIVFGN